MNTAPTPINRHRGTRPVTLTLRSLAALMAALIIVVLVVDRVFFSSNTPSSTGLGSGVAATQARALPPFREIALAGANNIVVNVGPTQSVIVHADDNLLARVTTRVRSGTLVIGNTPGSFSARTPMFVAVSVPALDAVTLQGAGNIALTRITGPSFAIRVPGSGTVRAAGTTARLEVTIGGSGAAFLGGLVARDATAALSGDGTIMLTATRSLRAHVSGSGSILYGGHPARVTTAVTGSGTVMPGPTG